MNTTTLVSPAHDGGGDRAPRLAAACARELRRACLVLWRGLETYGREKARRELADLHDRWQTSDPALAKQFRTAHAFLVAQGARRGDFRRGPPRRREATVAQALTLRADLLQQRYLVRRRRRARRGPDDQREVRCLRRRRAGASRAPTIRPRCRAPRLRHLAETGADRSPNPRGRCCAGRRARCRCRSTDRPRHQHARHLRPRPPPARLCCWWS